MTSFALWEQSLTGTVRTGAQIPDEYRIDRSGFNPVGAPEVLVQAKTVDDVQNAVIYAADTNLSVVIRGAGTGLAGGASAGSGSLVLDVSGLNRITDIAPADELAVVEPGVITATLDAEAGRHELRYAPDPASASISTIGGNIATNAGGLRCVKYGVTGDSVLGLSVVLADGRLIHTGRRTAKGVAGLDLTSLFTGSEGTLGVIVSATVRLQPKPTDTVTIAAYFDDVEQAAAATTAVLAARVRPSIMELLDEASLRQSRDFLGLPSMQRALLWSRKPTGSELISRRASCKKCSVSSALGSAWATTRRSPTSCWRFAEQRYLRWNATAERSSKTSRYLVPALPMRFGRSPRSPPATAPPSTRSATPATATCTPSSW